MNHFNNSTVHILNIVVDYLILKIEKGISFEEIKESIRRLFFFMRGI